MRKLIFASLIFFCTQVEAYSLRCEQIEGQSKASETLNMYDIESAARTSSVSGWQGLGAWQWGDSLVQWNYQNSDSTVITVQFAKSLFSDFLKRQIRTLDGDLYAHALSPHGLAIRCEMLPM